MRFVVKIGTSLVTTPENKLDTDFLRNISDQMAAEKKRGHEMILVTSGAVTAGRGELQIGREKKTMPYRQALAAVGQGKLMAAYREFFGAHGITVAQGLLTNYDFMNRENFRNTRNVFYLLLAGGALPVINENDVTTVAELKFGDNDMLSAKAAAMVSADCLFILTDVAGFYDSDPKNNPSAKLVKFIPEIDKSVLASAGIARSKSSLGGMVTKIEAAKYATSAGISMFIAQGKKEGILRELAGYCEKQNAGAPFDEKDLPCATFFPSNVCLIESRKKWLKPKIGKNAWIVVDDGAAEAVLKKGKSLLSSGIVKVNGNFRRGDVVVIKFGEKEIGYGQVNYGAEELDKIKKHRTEEIKTILGYEYEKETIHRDRMVLTS